MTRVGRFTVSVIQADNKCMKLASLRNTLLSRRRARRGDGRRDRIVSYGGAQSNAMLRIAKVAAEADACFDYFTYNLPKWLSNETTYPEGNLKDAVDLGMRLRQVHRQHDLKALADAEGSINANTFVVPRGGAYPMARDGVEELVKSAKFRKEMKGARTLVVPCGTGTTAFFLRQALDPIVDVIGVPCVGSAGYLESQFEYLSRQCDHESGRHQHVFPRVLHSTTKPIPFGQPEETVARTYRKLRDAFDGTLDFDLLYACVAWTQILRANSEDLPSKITFLHCGGIEGNRTQRPRYSREGIFLL